MTRPVPSYRRQRRPSGDLAFIEVNDRRIYLGPYGSPESKERYQRVLAEIESHRGELPAETDSLSVSELLARFWTFAETYYRRPDGSPTQELRNYKASLRHVRALYAETPARDFGPRCLRAVRQRMVDARLCRGYVNDSVSRVKRVFKWAVADELLSPSVYEALRCVPALRRGRSEARETDPVRPVALEHVEAIHEHVSRQVWAAIQLQLLTAARSGEILTMRPCDIDTSSDVWLYSPTEHKTAHHGHERTIFLGPKAQAVVRPFLLGRGREDFLFSPRQAEAERREKIHAARKTPESCCNTIGKNRRRNPERQAGDRYTVYSYGKAIARACKKAGIDRWHPHQLRHTAGTKIRKEFTLDAARLVLGHRSPAVTETYAEIDRGRAIEVMRQIG